MVKEWMEIVGNETIMEYKRRSLNANAGTNDLALQL
jgi:hypothetical protein